LKQHNATGVSRRKSQYGPQGESGKVSFVRVPGVFLRPGRGSVAGITKLVWMPKTRELPEGAFVGAAFRATFLLGVLFGDSDQ